MSASPSGTMSLWPDPEAPPTFLGACHVKRQRSHNSMHSACEPAAFGLFSAGWPDKWSMKTLLMDAEQEPCDLTEEGGGGGRG